MLYKIVEDIQWINNHEHLRWFKVNQRKWYWPIWKYTGMSFSNKDHAQQWINFQKLYQGYRRQ